MRQRRPSLIAIMFASIVSVVGFGVGVVLPQNSVCLVSSSIICKSVPLSWAFVGLLLGLTGAVVALILSLTYMWQMRSWLWLIITILITPVIVGLGSANHLLLSCIPLISCAYVVYRAIRKPRSKRISLPQFF